MTKVLSLKNIYFLFKKIVVVKTNCHLLFNVCL